MKKNLFILASAMAALALGACSNEEETHGVDLSKPISLDFRPAAVQTRATVGVEDAAFVINDVVGVYVSSSTLAGSEYANIKFTRDNSKWITKTLYWPSGTDSYTITAYYPFAGSENTAAATLSVSVPDNQSGNSYTKADYMWAQKTSVTPTNDAITLTMDHKMSLLKLDITASPNMGLGLSQINDMTPAILGSIPATGTWDLTTGDITPDDKGTTHQSIRPYAAYVTNQSLTYYALVMPGTTFKKGEIFFTLTDGENNTYSYTLNIEDGITAGSGKYVELDLTVTRKGINITSFDVGDWQPDQSGSGMVELE